MLWCGVRRSGCVESGVVRPDWDAVLRARIADAYYMRGNTAEAERYYADSLARLAQIGRGESVATYSIRSRWAWIAAETGDTLRALHDYEQLLQIVAASSLNGKPPAHLVGTRGILLAQLARYPEALAALDEAIELATRSKNADDLIARGSGARGRSCLHGERSRCRTRATGADVADGNAERCSTADLIPRVLRVRARIAAAEGRLSDGNRKLFRAHRTAGHPERDAGSRTGRAR